MKLVVGLGNPGSEYVNTRHNIGFDLLNYISLNKNFEFNNEKFKAKYCLINVNNEKVMLIKPLSYMNLSGEVVRKYVDYFKINKEDILVIQDDLDMELGRIKFVFNSSNGGHNGIRNIEDNLNTREYLRLKIGISKNKNIEIRDYVLDKFNEEEILKRDESFNKLIDVIDDFVNKDVNYLMNKYNNK